MDIIDNSRHIKNYSAKKEILEIIGHPGSIKNWLEYDFDSGDRFLGEYCDTIVNLLVLGVENGESVRKHGFYVRTTQKVIQEFDKPAKGVIVKTDDRAYTSDEYKSDLIEVWNKEFDIQAIS